MKGSELFVPDSPYVPLTIMDGVCYLHTDSARNLCGTVHNVASPEMLYCSSSSGEHFDRRARELRQCKSIVEGIIHHANRREDEQHESTKKQ